MVRARTICAVTVEFLEFVEGAMSDPFQPPSYGAGIQLEFIPGNRRHPGTARLGANLYGTTGTHSNDPNEPQLRGGLGLSRDFVNRNAQVSTFLDAQGPVNPTSGLPEHTGHLNAGAQFDHGRLQSATAQANYTWQPDADTRLSGFGQTQFNPTDDHWTTGAGVNYHHRFGPDSFTEGQYNYQANDGLGLGQSQLTNHTQHQLGNHTRLDAQTGAMWQGLGRDLQLGSQLQASNTLLPDSTTLPLPDWLRSTD
ncbi:MAG: hypothetical protein KC474_06240 [Cyanobacteria bacterium HKST-UBA04]|nr:hypothetical protein [Cyanobacteria bacterium HKST-UBA04]